MDVFLIIRCQKTTIFTDVKENTTILNLKRIIEGILKIDPEDQLLVNENGHENFDEKKTIADYNLNGSTAKAHSPAVVGLIQRNKNGEFEKLDISPLSCPPDLPEVMKQDAGMHEGGNN